MPATQKKGKDEKPFVTVNIRLYEQDQKNVEEYKAKHNFLHMTEAIRHMLQDAADADNKPPQSFDIVSLPQL